MSRPTDTEKCFRDYFCVTLCVLLGLPVSSCATHCSGASTFPYWYYEPNQSRLLESDLLHVFCVWVWRNTTWFSKKLHTENEPTNVSDWKNWSQKNWSQTSPWVLLLEALHVWRAGSLWCFSVVHCHHTSFSFTHHSSLHLSSVTSLSLCVLCFVLESLQMFTDVTNIILIMKSVTLFLCVRDVAVTTRTSPCLFVGGFYLLFLQLHRWQEASSSRAERGSGAAAVGGSEVASQPDKHPAADAEEEKPDLRMFPTHVVEKSCSWSSLHTFRNFVPLKK